MITVGLPFDFEALIHAAGDAIVVAAPDGAMLVWKRAVTNMRIHRCRSASDPSIQLFPNVSGSTLGGCSKGGADRPHAVRHGSAPCSRGPQRWATLSLAFTVALLYPSTKDVQTSAAIICDETNRWNEDQALSQELAELNAKSG